MSLLIRTATPDDLPVLGAVYTASHTLRRIKAEHDAITMQDRLDRYFQDNGAGITLAVTAGTGEVMGFAAWQRRRVMGRRKPVLGLDGLYSVPSAACAGSTLMSHLLTEQAAPGELVTAIPATDKAQAFYRRHGFGWLNAIDMGRRAGKKAKGIAP